MISFSFLVFTAIVTYLLWGLYSYFLSPLRKFPGPRLAAWTRLWYLLQVKSGASHLVLKRLHEELGPIVRIAPNVLNINLPECIDTIYDRKGEWRKTEFYHGSSALVDGEIIFNLFSETDPERHKQERKQVAKHYSRRSISFLEPKMNDTIKLLCNQLDKQCIGSPGAEKNGCDLGAWILYYAWDVVGTVTFSQPFGYLKEGRDFDATLGIAKIAMEYFAVIGTAPFLDRLLAKNPIFPMGPPGFDNITRISVNHLRQRLQKVRSDLDSPGIQDFLDKFLETQKAATGSVNEAQVVSWLMINMIAGADTTAGAIQSALYHSLKDPRIWERLTNEILQARFNDEPPSYDSARDLPYLKAVICEALRMSPGVCMTMERYVPKGGITLPSGDYIPEGYIVGMNPYVTNRNREIFGDKADDFCPERWVQDQNRGETQEAYEKRIKDMKSCDLTFGNGNRRCIGELMGLTQVYKVVFALITRYEMTLVDSERWSVKNFWFLQQEGLEVEIKKRTWR
ncbi:hypothetical protein CLIM01_14594 [Colletotrichum limetticola]|uniref:Cytochrome P450 n=1 Tax=Colletotrichum limetticola TaxID=1209924 RepID=A0ABQ9P7H1_9PEZI|nr:hypothetical protein CLIM01_14594 [Colletotrichum limetticola]